MAKGLQVSIRLSAPEAALLMERAVAREITPGQYAKRQLVDDLLDPVPQQLKEEVKHLRDEFRALREEIRALRQQAGAADEVMAEVRALRGAFDHFREEFIEALSR